MCPVIESNIHKNSADQASSIPVNEGTSLDHLIGADIAPASKLDADYFTVQDSEGITESIFGSGNLNYLTLQAHQNDTMLLTGQTGEITGREFMNANILSGISAAGGANFSSSDYSTFGFSTGDAATEGGAYLPPLSGNEFQAAAVAALAAPDLSILGVGEIDEAAAARGFSAGANAVAATSSAGDHRQTVNQGDTIVNNGGDTVTNVVNEAGDTVTNVVNEAGDTITNVVNEVGDTITNVVNDVGDTVTNVVNNVGDTVTEIVNNVDDTLETVTNIVNNLGDTVSPLIDQVVDTSTDVAGNVGSAVDDLLGQAGLGDLADVSAITDGISDAINDLAGTAGGLLGDPAGTLAGIVNDPLGAATDTVGTVTDLAGSVLDGTGLDAIVDPDALSGALDTAGDMLSGITSDPAGAIADILNNPVGTVAETVADVGNIVGGILDATSLDDAVDVGALVDPVVGITEGLGDLLENNQGGPGGGLLDIVGDIAETVVETTDGATGGTIDDLISALPGGGADSLAALAGGGSVATGDGALWPETQNLPGSDLLGDLAGDAADALAAPQGVIAEGLGILDTNQHSGQGGHLNLGGLFG